jgi:hypothetical protein
MGTKRRRGVNPDGATILPDQPDALPSSNFHDARMAGNGPGNLSDHGERRGAHYASGLRVRGD